MAICPFAHSRPPSLHSGPWQPYSPAHLDPIARPFFCSSANCPSDRYFPSLQRFLIPFHIRFFLAFQDANRATHITLLHATKLCVSISCVAPADTRRPSATRCARYVWQFTKAAPAATGTSGPSHLQSTLQAVLIIRGGYKIGFAPSARRPGNVPTLVMTQAAMTWAVTIPGRLKEALVLAPFPTLLHRINSSSPRLRGSLT